MPRLSIQAHGAHPVGLFLVIALACLGCGSPADSGPATSPERSESPSTARRVERPSTLLPQQQPRDVTPRPPRPDDWFEDVTAPWGIDFAYRDGNDAGRYTLLETLGGGAALFDFNGNGRLDLFVTGGGSFSGPSKEVRGRSGVLYRNDGDGRFTDVTAEMGLDASDLYTHGAAVGDFDGDGWPDLLVLGYGGVRLYRNRDGTGFDDVTAAAGLDACDGWNVAAAWADFDNDGRLDLFVVTYCQWDPATNPRCNNPDGVRDVCGPSRFAGKRDRLFRNRGDGTFEDVTEQAGLVPSNRGLGVVAADFDGDGWIDFYVANDVQENFLYRGGPDLPLTNEAVALGVAFSPLGGEQGSMGLDIGDFDGDGRPDLFYTNFSDEDNSLYRNLSEGGFLDAADPSGLNPRSRRWVGWGTALADFDGDGWPDLVVANGHVWYHRLESPYFQPPQLFRNVEGRRFVEVSDRGGPYFSLRHAGRGLAVGDLDNDGGLDLVIVHQNDPVVVLRNRRPPEHWVRVALRGVRSNPDAVGARVVARCGGRDVTHWVRGGGGYLSHFDSRFLFPVPDGRPLDVTVHWPAGGTEVFEGLSLHETHLLVEGAGRRP